MRSLNYQITHNTGLKTGMENGMFWSEIESGFGEQCGTPLPGGGGGGGLRYGDVFRSNEMEMKLRTTNTELVC